VFSGLPDISLEQGPPRYLIQSVYDFQTQNNLVNDIKRDPWGSVDLRHRFNFKYGILISNRNDSCNYLEFRDLGQISFLTKRI
jgi:hypothetical protein